MVIMANRTSFVKIDLTLQNFPELYDTLNELIVHYNKTLREIIWILLHSEPSLCRYNNKPSFISYTKGYSRYCGHYCQCMKEDVSNFKRNKSVQEKERTNAKREETMLAKYGVRCGLMPGEVRNKASDTMQERYGVKSPQQSKEIRNKTIATNLEKYGAETALSANSTKREQINANLKDNAGARLTKSKNTLQQRYGVDNISQIPEILEKKKQTFLANFGETHFMKSVEGKEIYKNSISDKFGSHITNVKQIHLSEQTINCLHNCNEFKTIAAGKTLSQIAEELGIAETTAGKKVIEFNLQDVVVYNSNISSGHRHISEWLNSLNISHTNNNRNIISPFEIDIFIPDYNLGIEYCGLYFHSEISGNKDQFYHQTKYELANQKNVQLLTIYDTEWLNKQHIVKNIILSKLRKYPIDIKDENIAKDHILEVGWFCNAYHLNGFINGQIFSLRVNNCIHAVMIIDELSNVSEILRYYTDGFVTDAFSKLVNYICSMYEINQVSIVIDHRFETFEMYRQLGFELIETTIDFDNVNNNDRIWNCGISRLTLDVKLYQSNNYIRGE